MLQPQFWCFQNWLISIVRQLKAVEKIQWYLSLILICIHLSLPCGDQIDLTVGTHDHILGTSMLLNEIFNYKNTWRLTSLWSAVEVKWHIVLTKEWSECSTISSFFTLTFVHSSFSWLEYNSTRCEYTGNNFSSLNQHFPCDSKHFILFLLFIFLFLFVVGDILKINISHMTVNTSYSSCLPFFFLSCETS